MLLRAPIGSGTRGGRKANRLTIIDNAASVQPSACKTLARINNGITTNYKINCKPLFGSWLHFPIKSRLLVHKTSRQIGGWEAAAADDDDDDEGHDGNNSAQ